MFSVCNLQHVSLNISFRCKYVNIHSFISIRDRHNHISKCWHANTHTIDGSPIPGRASIATIPHKWFILKSNIGRRGQTKNKFASLDAGPLEWNTTVDHFFSIVSDPTILSLFTGRAKLAFAWRNVPLGQHCTESHSGTVVFMPLTISLAGRILSQGFCYTASCWRRINTEHIKFNVM